MQPLNASTFHLILELSAPGAADRPAPAPAGASAAPRHVLPLPGTVSILSILPNQSPALHAAPLESREHELVLEPVIRPNSMPRLVLVNPTSRKLCLNGERATRVSLLRERDQFHWDDSTTFHIAIFHRPQIGPAQADTIGRSCPICFAPFAASADTVCYRCPCGTVLHLSDATGLECARAVKACPTCKLSILLQEGYDWLPEFCHE